MRESESTLLGGEMECPVQRSLFNEWKRAAVLYAELSITSLAPTGVEATVDLNQTLIQVGQIADKLHSDLTEHVKTHGCGSDIFRRGAVFPTAPNDRSP